MDRNVFGLGTHQLQAIENFLSSTNFGSDHTQRVADLSTSISNRDTSKTATILSDALQSFGTLYPLALILEVEDVVKSVYADAGIDDGVRDATLSDVRLWVDQYASQHNGAIGLDRVFWISRHLCANILRLGRLQFEAKAFGYPYQLFRHIKDDTMVIVAGGGLSCDRDGYLIDDQHAAFYTSFQDETSQVSAHLVNTTQGTIDRQTTQLNLQDYHLIADSETVVLHLHIPSGSPLTPSSVDESLAIAKIYFPSISFVVCSSWLLDPALDLVTSQESNTREFMHRFRKFPVMHEVPQIYERVFGFGLGETEVLAYNATSSLQRRVQQALISGTKFHTTGGYVTNLSS
ncbi:acyltransferase domain-containing protein [uncultured Sphaerochaeta sp.]|uniref:acyltransferase domain-containing protein n=1 Tax=uncultured Sphaerochaeta sp. TaxID=886478 RepID=UPI002AA83D89|nr:acyltransferase domain-containing protein [uncultured Sphaerochaeta sp.]